jgi:hypothetical protein
LHNSPPNRLAATGPGPAPRPALRADRGLAGTCASVCNKDLPPIAAREAVCGQGVDGAQCAGTILLCLHAGNVSYMRAQVRCGD